MAGARPCVKQVEDSSPAPSQGLARLKQGVQYLTHEPESSLRLLREGCKLRLFPRNPELAHRRVSMQRRTFIQTSLATMCSDATATAVARAELPGSPVYELRTYSLKGGKQP